jgi:hypothetical protein
MCCTLLLLLLAHLATIKNCGAAAHKLLQQLLLVLPSQLCMLPRMSHPQQDNISHPLPAVVYKQLLLLLVNYCKAPALYAGSAAKN